MNLRISLTRKTDFGNIPYSDNSDDESAHDSDEQINVSSEHDKGGRQLLSSVSGPALASGSRDTHCQVKVGNILLGLETVSSKHPRTWCEMSKDHFLEYLKTPGSKKVWSKKDFPSNQAFRAW